MGKANTAGVLLPVSAPFAPHLGGRLPWTLLTFPHVGAGEGRGAGRQQERERGRCVEIRERKIAERPSQNRRGLVTALA